jgi:hypothetical protein
MVTWGFAIRRKRNRIDATTENITPLKMPKKQHPPVSYRRHPKIKPAGMPEMLEIGDFYEV